MGQFKQGLDYFPFTIGLLKDRKLRRAKMKFGCVASNIYLSLLELIYGDKGYYLRYDEDTKADVIWEILINLQGKFQPTAETVEEVIEELVACELFSGDHFNAKILTSKRIQQTYYSATVERQAVDIDFDIWMLSEEEMRKLSSRSFILKNFLNRSNDGANRSNDGANRSNDGQRTEKKRKENKKDIDSQTGEQSELEFYLESIHCHLDDSGLDDAYKSRFEDIINELMRRDSLKINGIELPIVKILQAFVQLFVNPEKIPDLLYAGNKDGVKNKFLYTVSAMYNGAYGF